MGLSLRKIGKSLYETLTPQNEDAIRRANASQAAAQQRIMALGNRSRGVLAQPQARQQFIQQNRAPRFNLYDAQARSMGAAGRDVLLQPTTRGIARIGASAIQPITKQPEIRPEGRVLQTVFGSRPIETYQQEFATNRAKRGLLPAVGMVGLSAATDVPLGPGRAKGVAKAVSPALPRVSPKTPPTPVRATAKSAGQGTKVRGFTKNVFKANFYEGDDNVKKLVESMSRYRPTTNKGTLRGAANEVNADPSRAFARIATKKQLDSAHDTATAQLLLRRSIEGDDMESALQLGKKLGVDGTKLGQAIQVYSAWKKTTPEGILRYGVKKAGEAGKELDPVVAKQLADRARQVASMPEGFEKARATRELLGQAEGLGRNWRGVAQEIVSTPRAAMATADLSAPLRQGAVLGARFPKEFKSAFKEQVKYFGRPEHFEKSMYEITTRKSYPLMKQHKLAVTGATELTGTEELFMKSLLETAPAKKVGVGHVVSASNRAYSGFLTKFRADVFDRILKDAQATGVKLDKKALDSLARFINTASGRGGLGAMEKSAGLLSQAFFSPRLWASRINLLNPVYYARLQGPARKYALQTSGAFAGIAATVLGVAAAAGATVEWNPKSADFAKIKIGNTRYDILGGLQQHLRLGAQLATGEKINTVTGATQTLGPDRGFGKPSRLDLLQQFVENKENPIVSYGTKLLRGTDQVGEPINVAKETGKLFTPLNLQQGYETAKDVGSVSRGAGMASPGLLGIGVQTYGLQPTKDKDKPLTEKQAQTLTNAEKQMFKEGKTPKTGKKLGDGMFQLSDGKFYTKVGDRFRSFDDQEDARLAVAKDRFEKSGKAFEVYGDSVLRRNKDGSTRVQSKLTYDSAILANKLQAAKKSKNMDEWFRVADSQLANLNEQLKDPTLDELEKSNIQEKINNLVASAAKYGGSGGGGRGGSRKGGSKSAGRKTAGSAYKYAVSPGAGGKSVKPKVTIRAGKAKAKAKKYAAAKPKVSIRRSKV